MRKKLRIFLADDNPSEAPLLLQGFVECGVDVDIHAAKDGEDALAQLTQDSSSFDLVVLDYYLPKRTGGEVVQALVAAAAFPQCPVVILTSTLPEELRIKALNLGVSAVLDKPGDLDGYNKLASRLLQIVGSEA